MNYKLASMVKSLLILVALGSCLQTFALDRGQDQIKLDAITKIINMEYRLLAAVGYRQRHSFRTLLNSKKLDLGTFIKQANERFMSVLNNPRISKAIRKRTIENYALFSQVTKMSSVGLSSLNPGKVVKVTVQETPKQSLTSLYSIAIYSLIGGLAMIGFFLAIRLKLKNRSIEQSSDELKLTITDLRKKIKLKKNRNIRYIPAVGEVSTYAIAYLGTDGELISKNKIFAGYFGKNILVGDNWDDFFAKNFTKSVTKLKNKMVIYRYIHDSKQVYAVSSKLIKSDKSEFRICEIIPFDTKDLNNISEHYGKGLSDNFVDLGDVFEQAFSGTGQLQMGQSLNFPIFHDSSERFLHIGYDKSYRLARYIGRLSHAISLLMSKSGSTPLKGDLGISFNRAENCLFDLSFLNINLKQEMNTYFNMFGKKQTLTSILEELDIVLNEIGFEVSVVVKEQEGQMLSVIHLEVVDIFTYQIKQSSFNSTSSTIM